MKEIDCVQFLTVVDDLLECSDDIWEESIARHLRDCPPCEIFLEQLQDLRTVLQMQQDEALPPEDPRIAAILHKACSTA
jgi:hypothetical protein